MCSTTVQPYPSLLPVLVVEAISLDVVPFGSLSVKISENGWAWLVCGRQLFVWKYKREEPHQQQLQNRVVPSSCYQLQLPASDLAHKAELVCVLSVSCTIGGTHNEKGSQPLPGVIAVSPEGIIRFWPNIAYEGHSIEASAYDLQGQECISLTNMQPLGCILGTTTSSLVHVTINNTDGHNAIICRTLKTPQGVLAGFSRRVSSFIFGSMPATQSPETRQLIKILREMMSVDGDITDRPDGANDEGQYFYVLASSCLQKWHIINQFSDRLVNEFDFERAVRDAFLDQVWNRETTHPNQLQIWPIDVASTQPGVLVILVAGLNADVSNQLYYALAKIDYHSFAELSRHSQSSFISFTVLRNHTVCYSHEDEEDLLNLHLLTGTLNPNAVYIYNQSRVLYVLIGNNDVEVIDFGSREDRILGAGVSEGIPLLFTHKDALVSLISPHYDLGPMQDIPPIEVEFEQNDPVARLKTAFMLYIKGENNLSLSLLRSLFPSASEDSSDIGLDEMVVTVSNEVCDEPPASDPRWGQSSDTYDPQSNPFQTTASVIIAKQLEEKRRMHHLLIEFLKNFGFWERLTTYTMQKARMPTRLILAENAEKLIAALTLRKLHADYNNLLEASIDLVLQERAVEIPFNVTSHDVFYRQTTRIEDLIIALIDYESDQINSVLTNSRDILTLVIQVAHILITVFQEISYFRQTQGSTFEVTATDDAAFRCEYIPWSSTTGDDGIRTALLKQFELIEKYGIDSTNVAAAIEDDVQLKGVIYQKIVELADIILDGYLCHLKSIEFDVERHNAVERTFVAHRTKCLRPLMKVKQFERATALAEKYEDFDVLIRICDELGNRERLQRYIEDFSHRGFADYLFKWYLKEGKQGKMLREAADVDSLGNFLKDHTRLNWLHQIHHDQYGSASQTLKTLSVNERKYLGRKKTLLSLSKLCALAESEDAFTNVDVSEVDTQLDLILYQETLPVSVREAFNLDVEMMPVMSPRELISLYVSEQNVEADAYDFKKALELISFINDEDDVGGEERQKLKLQIWDAANRRNLAQELE